MPKGKKKQTTKASRGRRASARSSGGTGRGSMSGAPAAVSDFLKQHIRFGGNGENLKMSGLIAIANIGTADVADETSGFIDGAGNPFQAIKLSPTGPLGVPPTGGSATAAEFISPALDLIGSAFTRYKVDKCKFHYRPQSGTNSTQQLVFAFAADPEHDILLGDGAPITPSALESLSDSIPFAPWAPWDLDVSGKLDKGPWQYTHASNNASNPFVNRLDCFGAIGCAVGTESTDTAVNYGVLYMSFDMEFKEFCPISGTFPSLSHLHKKLSVQLDKEVQRRARRLVKEPNSTGQSKEARHHSEKCCARADPGCSDPCTLFCVHASSSSSLPNPTRETITVEQLRRYSQRLRSEGWEMREAVSHLASLYTFSAEAQKLCRDSGIELPKESVVTKHPKGSLVSVDNDGCLITSPGLQDSDDSSDDDGFLCTPSVSLRAATAGVSHAGSTSRVGEKKND